MCHKPINAERLVRRSDGRRKKQRQNPRFADPFFLRRARRGHIEPAAGPDGSPSEGATIIRNGKLVHVADFHDPLIPRPVDSPAPSILFELRRRLSKQLAVYRLSGEFSDDDLSLIEAILSGKDLSEWARQKGVSRQAAWDRVQRLKNRAPFVWLAWCRISHRKDLK